MNNISKLNRASWAYQKQTDPPNFGKAKILPRWLMNILIYLRRNKNIKILNDDKFKSKINKNNVSVIILSCKRLNELKRLINSLEKFFKNIETYKLIEFILVDNGSDEELLRWVKNSKFFKLQRKKN